MEVRHRSTLSTMSLILPHRGSGDDPISFGDTLVSDVSIRGLRKCSMIVQVSVLSESVYRRPCFRVTLV